MTPREAATKAFYECEGNNEACLKAAFDAFEASPLIAAAPAMLAALNVARGRLGEGPIDVMRSTLAQIDDAISKAS